MDFHVIYIANVDDDKNLIIFLLALLKFKFKKALNKNILNKNGKIELYTLSKIDAPSKKIPFWVIKYIIKNGILEAKANNSTII